MSLKPRLSSFLRSSRLSKVDILQSLISFLLAYSKNLLFFPVFLLRHIERFLFLDFGLSLRHSEWRNLHTMRKDDPLFILTGETLKQLPLLRWTNTFSPFLCCWPPTFFSSDRIFCFEKMRKEELSGLRLKPCKLWSIEQIIVKPSVSCDRAKSPLFICRKQFYNEINKINYHRLIFACHDGPNAYWLLKHWHWGWKGQMKKWKLMLNDTFRLLGRSFFLALANVLHIVYCLLWSTFSKHELQALMCYHP